MPINQQRHQQRNKQMNVTKSLLKLAILPIVAGHLPAATISYPDFSDVSSLTLSGSARQVTTTDGTVMRLANAVRFNNGTAWTVGEYDASTFSSQFQFRITNANSEAPALADDPEPGGDGIFFNVGNSAVGDTNSFSVWFHTWMAPGDPSSNSIRVSQGGSTISLVDAAGGGMRFDDGELWTAWIDFADGVLEVRADKSSTRPSAALLSTDLLAVPSDPVHLGFFSFTGGAWGDHDVVNWSYGAAVPEPSSLLLAGGGLLLLLRRNRRLEELASRPLRSGHRSKDGRSIRESD